jgi:hypothetical protein
LAIVGNEIWLEFSGGIRSAIHESKIDESELADGENFIARDGTVQLDQRYILAAQVGSSDLSCQGSGYGKYEDCEQYVAVIGGDLYLVDLTVSPLALTPVIGGGGLAAGNWFFDQYESYIYAANATAGLVRKKVCAGTDGTGDWSGLQRPTAPASAPTHSIYNEIDSSTATGATITDSGSSISVANGGTTLVVTMTGQGEHWIEVELDTSPDERMDSEYRDIWLTYFTRSSDLIGIKPTKILEGTTTYTLAFWRAEGGWPAQFVYERLQHIPRSGRNQITKLRYEFLAPAGTSVVTIQMPSMCGVWMSLPLSYNPPFGNGTPVFPPLKYACTYVNQTTGLESSPGPLLTIPAASQLMTGQWVDITLPTTAESGVSHVRLYRVVGDEGSETYYELTEAANSGTPTYRDKLSVDEVLVLDEFTPPGDIPATGVNALAVWQQRLCVAVGNLVQVSRSDDELAFAPLSGNVDEFDIGNGLTFFCDDRKSEEVLGLYAGDALTVVTNRSVRALFGTIPQNWRYVKLNCNEGAVGPRAWCGIRDGVVVLTPSGRLLYVALGQEEPLDLGAKIRDRIGNEGLKALATEDAIVALRPDGQLEIRNSTGRYYIIDIDGAVRKGTHTHPTHSALFISGLPIRWLGTNGKLYEGGSDDYVTDGGTTGTNGSEVEWYVDSRQYSLPRTSVESIYLGNSTEHLTPGNVMIAPRVTIFSAKRTKEYKKLKGK